MAKTNSQRALTILIFTALAVAVGCGDGKRNSRGKVDRAVSLNKTGLNKPAAGTNGEAGKTGASGTGAEAPVDNTKTNTQISSIYSTQTAGAALQTENVEGGTYELVTVSSEAQIGTVDKADLRAIRTDDVSVGTPKEPLHARADQTAGFGSLDPQDSGRNISVPARFTTEDGALKIENSKQDWVYESAIKKVEGQIQMSGVMTSNNGQNIATSLADLVAGAQADSLRKVRLEFKVLRPEANTIRFVVTFNESGDTAKAGDKTAALASRTFVFTYKSNGIRKASETAPAKPDAQAPVMDEA